MQTEYFRTPTIQIHGGGGTVMAPLVHSGQFYEGKWTTVMVTDVLKDKDVPLPLREALVGLTLDTIFTKRQMVKASSAFDDKIPDGARLTYARDVARAFAEAGKKDLADAYKAAMKELYPGEDWAMTMLVIEEDEYEVVPDD